MSEELPKSGQVEQRQVTYTEVVTTNWSITTVPDEVRQEFFRRAAVPTLLWQATVGPMNPMDPNSMTHQEWAAKLAASLENNSVLVIPQLTAGASGMYERFSDRARKVMQLANQESQRFNHEYIGTEHILLGLVKEGSGVAASVLKNLEVDLRKIRLEVERIVTASQNGVLLDRRPWTPEAKKVIEYSIEEARNLNHSYVGTEHVLLGLLGTTDNVAVRVLEALGVTAEKAKQEILTLLRITDQPEADIPQVVQ